VPERTDLPLWARVLLPALVVTVALVVGSRAFDSAPQTAAQRAASIESTVRCPSCIDVSVAQSNESTALAVRHEIQRQVAAGRTTAQIEQTLVSQYGPTILLEPPGRFQLLWLLPIGLGAGAVIVIGALFWRRSRQFAALRGADSS
jgi:cytochrome c-type biogenesis protein CcmH/NrfF